MKIFFFVMMIIFSMGFFLLLERKVLSLINFRSGPNKVLYMGLLQFMLDSLKLVFKELGFESLNFLGLLFFVLFFLMNIFLWFLISNGFILVLFKYSMLLLIFFLMLKLLFFMWMVFISDSVYSYLGLVRSLVQLISYDLIIIFVFMIFFVVFSSFDFGLIFFVQLNVPLFFFSPVFFLIWFFSILMELSRMPFDLIEGESELVSGFNIEFSSVCFMLVFMVEYLDIVFMIYLTVKLFLFTDLFYLYYIFFMYMVLFIRGVLVRFRYDYLVYMVWLKFFSLLLIVMFVFLIVWVL